MPKLDLSVALSKKEAIQAGLSHYCTKIPCRNGHIANRTLKGRCLACALARNSAWNLANPEIHEKRTSKYYLANKSRLTLRTKLRRRGNDQFKKKQREWLDANQERVRETRRKWIEKNSDKMDGYKAVQKEVRSTSTYKKEHAIYSRTWIENNRERHALNVAAYAKNNPERIAQYKNNSLKRNPNRRREYHQRRKSDPIYRLPQVIRCRLHALMRSVKHRERLVEGLGCSIKFLIKYIENQFVNGMTWANHGFKTWHLDHIRSLSSFDLSDPEQRKIAIHYTNLQPLSAHENLVKSGIKKKTLARLKLQNSLESCSQWNNNPPAPELTANFASLTPPLYEKISTNIA